jgi:positive regulator of sigma E activity
MERSKYVAQNKRISLVRCETLTKCTSASSNSSPGKHSEIKAVVLNNQAKFLK